MKILILILAASLCLAQDDSLVTGVISGAACVTTGLGCYSAVADAADYLYNMLRVATPTQSCTSTASSIINTAVSDYNGEASWSGITSLISAAGQVVSIYTTNCVSSKLQAIPAELKTALRKIASDVHNVGSKFNSYVSTKNHEMGVKQFFYRGMDVTTHVHAIAGAYLTGSRVNGDKFFSFGTALGNFAGFISATESLSTSVNPSE